MSEAEFDSFDPRRAEFAARLADIERAPDTLRAIVAAAGLRPEADLRFGDLADCDFDADDLRGFDFTGCDLTRSTFVGARIRGAKFDCARYDPRALAKADDYAEFEADNAKRGPADRFDPAGLRRFAPFREAPFAPEMLVLPAGEFAMGSNLADLELPEDDRAYEDEVVPGQGKRRMRIPRRFALGKYTVTFEEYDTFAEATGRERPGDRGWGRARLPVVNVDWDDATAYTGWLNERLGIASYRLPSEAEWEFACRARRDTPRWWGDAWDSSRANGNGEFEGGRTSPVDRFEPNSWGLHDMIGNVWEWCADVWVEAIGDLPEDGAPFGFATDGLRTKRGKTQIFAAKSIPGRRVNRGGSWIDDPRDLRAADRGNNGPSDRYSNLGFRVARTLLT